MLFSISNVFLSLLDQLVMSLPAPPSCLTMLPRETNWEIHILLMDPQAYFLCKGSDAAYLVCKLMLTVSKMAHEVGLEALDKDIYCVSHMHDVGHSSSLPLWVVSKAFSKSVMLIYSASLCVSVASFTLCTVQMMVCRVNIWSAHPLPLLKPAFFLRWLPTASDIHCLIILARVLLGIDQQ